MNLKINRYIFIIIVLFSYSQNSSAQLSKEECNKKGKLKVKIKDYQGAMQYFEFGLIDNPKSSDLYNNIGNIYFTKKYYQKAEQHYSIALTNNTQNPSIYINRALSRIECKKLKDAISDLKAAIKLESDNHYAKSLLAYAYVESKDYENGLKLINEAIEGNKNEYRYYVTRSRCVQYLNNELLAAIKDLDKAIELAPDRAELFTRRAEIRAQVGDMDGSKSDTKKAKSLSKMDFILDSEKLPIIYL